MVVLKNIMKVDFELLILGNLEIVTLFLTISVVGSGNGLVRIRSVFVRILTFDVGNEV